MKIAFISNPAVQCGVSQFGMDTVAALQSHSRHEILYYTLGGREDFEAAFAAIAEADIALYNYHPLTLGFLTRDDILRAGKPAIELLHEFDQISVHTNLSALFRYRIAPDPTLVSRFPGLWAVPRIVPQIKVSSPENEIFTVGTFGFATGYKNYEEIITFTARHFNRSRVRLHIPSSFYCDSGGSLARQVYQFCQEKTAGRVDLEFSDKYFSTEDLIAYLAGNDLNIFLYDKLLGRGISSVLDFAIASERPLALSSSNMFRHVRHFAPELFLEHSSPQHILKIGSDACRRLKALWIPEKGAQSYDAIFEEVAEDYVRAHTQRLNTVLTDDFRNLLQPKEEEIQRVCPDVFARKIPRANVQQAFVLTEVEKHAELHSSILCVGYNEDTAYFALKAKGYEIDAIDPLFDIDLAEFFERHAGKRYYDVIFSTSVLEHVPDDEAFMSQIAALLAPGGVAILTMDFKENYVVGEPIPQTDERFYTTERLLRLLLPHLHGCKLLDAPDWSEHQPDFELGGCNYGFAALLFQKSSGVPNSLTTLYETQLRESLSQAREAKILSCYNKLQRDLSSGRK